MQLRRLLKLNANFSKYTKFTDQNRQQYNTCTAGDDHGPCKIKSMVSIYCGSMCGYAWNELRLRQLSRTKILWYLSEV